MAVSYLSGIKLTGRDAWKWEIVTATIFDIGLAGARRFARRALAKNSGCHRFRAQANERKAEIAREFAGAFDNKALAVM